MSRYLVSPFFELQSDEEVEDNLKRNITAFVDPRYKERSFAEAKLVDFIQLCWVFAPDKRIDIFQLVELLRVAVKENNEREGLKVRLASENFHVLLAKHNSVVAESAIKHID
jgi:hypothetical protein